MAKYLIEFNRAKCIGAAACVVAASKFWKIVSDGKADLIGGKRQDKNRIQVREITDKDLKVNLEAAKSCPVKVIHIKDLKTGKKLI